MLGSGLRYALLLSVNATTHKLLLGSDLTWDARSYDCDEDTWLPSPCGSAHAEDSLHKIK